MKKILNLLWLLFAVIATTSCSDDDMSNETGNVRDYQTDAQVLAKFVDIDKAKGEYFINSNKKVSPLSYITNTDYTEFQSVNPVNYQRYENILKEINSKLAAMASDPEVSYIVFGTYGETYVKKVNENSLINMEKTYNTISTKSTRYTIPDMYIYPYDQQHQFTSNPQVRTDVTLSPFITPGSYFFFQLICTTGTKQYPSPNPEMDRVIFSGFSLGESSFLWTANQPSGSSTEWKFKGQAFNPTDKGYVAIIKFTE